MDKERAKKRVEDLMAKALSCASEEVDAIEEAKTSAMIAVKIIAEYGLVVCASHTGSSVREKAKAPPSPPPPKPAPAPEEQPWTGFRWQYEPSKDEGFWMRSKFKTSNCRYCAGVIHEKQWILYGGAGRGAMCERCVWRKVAA